MQGKHYWIERAKELLLLNTRRADAVSRDLYFLYEEAASQVEAEIGAMYAKYAADNALTRAQASRLLSGKEYSVWRTSMAGYLADIPDGARQSKTLLELNTLAAKSRISRHEALLSNIYRNMIGLAGDTEARLTDFLADTVKVNYNRSAYALQRGVGAGFCIPRIDERTLHNILTYPWSGKCYSEAVWDNVDLLAATAKREIALGEIKGSSVQAMAKQIDNVMGKGQYAAERLVRTECKAFAGQGELLSYKAHNVTHYRYIGGTEGSTHCECATHNGKEYAVADAVPGVNYPPLHPNCLCITVAVPEIDMFGELNAQPISTRADFAAWEKKYGLSRPD